MPQQSTDDPDDFDPYHKWLGIPLNKRPPTYYQILGISPNETDPDTITAAAERHESFVKQFRGGPLASHVSTILFQVEQARMTLLDRAAREKYDNALRVAQRKRRKIALGAEPDPPFAASSKSIGEESGLARQFFGITGIIAGGMIGIYLLAVFVPWHVLKNDPAPTPVSSVSDQSPVNPTAVKPQGTTLPNGNREIVKPPATEQLDPKQPDANPADSAANNVQLVAFFKSIVTCQRKSAEAFNKVSGLLDKCVHNEGGEISLLEEAMQDADAARMLADNELDATAIPDEGADLQNLVAAMHDWIKAENQVLQMVVPDAIRALRNNALSSKERAETFTTIRRAAAPIEHAANLALIETENAFFKNNRLPPPGQLAMDFAVVRAALDSVGMRGRPVGQSKPPDAFPADSSVQVAMRGEIADALAEHFVALFNGQDTSGWRAHPKQPGEWRVENGILISPRKVVGSLYSVREDFSDFQLRLEARIDDKGDSGVWFRVPFDPKFPAGSPARSSAFEAQINSTGADAQKTGTLFIDGRAPNPVRATPVRPGQWFTLDVMAQDNNVVVRVDGVRTANYIDNERRFRKGCIILQKTDPGTLIEFRRIEIIEIKR